MPDFRTMFSRDYIGAWDLGGRDVVVTIDKVLAGELQNKKGTDKKPIVFFVGKKLGFPLNKTNAKAIANLFGSNTDDWAGKKITIYPTKVDMAGDQVDAIRVRPRAPDVNAPNGEMTELGSAP